MADTPVRSRRLLLVFAATTLVPTMSLVWVGWQLAARDRSHEGSRAEARRIEGREHAVDLAVSSLHSMLAEAEEKLTEFNAAPGARVSLASGAALVAFERDGVTGRAGTELPWYPAVPARVVAGHAAFDESLEFRERNLEAALKALDGPAASPEPAVRSEALLRKARIQRQLGHTPQALEAFDALGALGDTRTVSGLPAGLAAVLGRAAIFEAMARRDDLRREVLALRHDLAKGRWLMTQLEHDAALLLAEGWAPKAAQGFIDPERAALAQVAEELWRGWQVRPPLSERGRALHRVGNLSVLVLTRSSSERLTALLLAPSYLTSVGLNDRADRTGRVAFALTDGDGPVLGRVGAPVSMQSIRPPSETQLPWTVHAIDVQGPQPRPPISRTTRLLLSGIALMILLVLAVAYFIHRTMTRELTVAQLQSDFVAAVSHEFRTPLTTMRQLSELLVRGRFSSEARRHEFYATLLRESGRLQTLVEGVLDFKRFEAGGAAYRFETTDAGDLVREVISDFDKHMTERGFQVELTMPDHDTFVMADRDALRRAIWNLLDNAAKYSPDCRTIWVDLHRSADRVSITVRDQGLGIPANQQQAVFERFVRGTQSTALGISGTGIGLAVVKTIVQAHGGEIQLASEPGRGSRFTVLLRAAEGLS